MKTSFKTPSKTIRIPELKISWLHLVAALFAFLYFNTCSTKNNLENEISSFNEWKKDSLVYYKNKLGEEVASRKALEGGKQTLQLLLSDARDSTKQLATLASYYKNVSAAVRTETITQIDSIEVPYYIDGAEFSVPFKKTEKFYSLSGRSTNVGLFLDHISIPNSQSIVIGDRKKGFWNTEYRMEVVNSNPFIKTTLADGYSFKEKRRRFGLGLSAGYGVSNTGLSPIVAISFNWNLIQF